MATADWGVKRVGRFFEELTDGLTENIPKYVVNIYGIYNMCTVNNVM